MASLGPPGSGAIFLENLNCKGNETYLLSCMENQLLGLSDCVHSEDVRMICPGKVYRSNIKIVTT